jgi:DNA repair protein RadA/Sms
LNITGGISVDDPAIDLAVVAAILSSNEDIPVDFLLCWRSRTVWRDSSVNRVNQRIQEAEKLGSLLFVSKYNKIALKTLVLK